MKLIQLNMWDGFLEHPLMQFLEREQPDVLCLQELKYTAQVPCVLEAIKKKTGLNYHYVSPLLGYTQAHMKFEWSNALISRYPLLETETHFVHNQYCSDWVWTEDFNYRNFQYARIEVDGTDYHLVNYHGYHIPGTKLGNDVTMRIMRDIYDYIKKLSGHVILTGGFNLTPDSPSLAELNAGMRNLCIEHKVETTRNFIAKRLVEVLDYIYVSHDVPVKSFHVADDIVSDHQALVMEI